MRASIPTLSADKRRRLRRLSLGLSAILLFALLWGFVIEPRTLAVHEETLTLSPWPELETPLVVVHLSDLHLGSPHFSRTRIAEIVARVNALEADVVMMTGDYLISGILFGEKIPAPELVPLLSELRAKHGVFAVLGNHDWWEDGLGVIDALQSANIIVLENNAASFIHEGKKIWVAGVADHMTREVRIDLALANVPEGEPTLLLTHSPDIFPEIPDRVSLTLAGHTHGGQVRLPWIGSPVVPSHFGQRFARWHIVEGGRQMFVSTGLGMSILPVRFGVPPEIAVLHLRSGTR